MLGAIILSSTATLAGAAPLQVRASSRALAASARSVGKGHGLLIKGLALQGQTENSTLELQRFEVWKADAVIEVDGRRASPPDTYYFRGTVDGDAASVAVLSVRDSGEVQGVVQKGGKSWVIGKGRTQRALHSRTADANELPPFECGNDDAFSPAERLGTTDAAPQIASIDQVAASGTVLDQTRAASIAIETDYEYYAKFGNTANALDYMGDLIGYADVTYSREIDTDMQIGYARLWTGGASSDPWVSAACVDANGDGISDVTPCGTSGLLGELRTYWNANMTGVNRTLVHMLSGKNLGGGIAYIGVLCQNYYAKGSSSDYGLSSSLGANFNWDGDQTHNPSTVVWDIIVVQHEIGHNFNSPHTHDYCNIGGSALPIDNCWAGCQAGATVALPSCTAKTPYFTSGGGAGTLMSYCHQRSGGYGNIAMTFGEFQPCGTMPNRESSRMAAHVTARQASYPACFATQTPTCGNGVLDPGEQCDAGNLGGATCASRGFAGGTLTCTSTCTWNTSQCTTCGNNVIDAGEVCDGTALAGNTCTQQGCTGGGVLACNSTCSGFVKTGCLACPICDGDGICETGEDCNGCPSDCKKGTTTGAVCGNHVCEAGNGEDCVSCPSDCNGVQGGKQNGRYCCGDGGGIGAIPCSDTRCTASGRQCITTKVVAGSYCCGNDVCEAGENCSSCATDCAQASEICGNGLDDNCNGKVDCSDTTACGTSPSCLCKGPGASCSLGSQCCSGVCPTSGKTAYTCN